MAPLAPFERPPSLAVGVSGGADSLALALLAEGWARARGGNVLALTVDHGLRADSAAEARQVAAWLARHGIAHRTLAWHPPTALGNLQEAARRARYVRLEAAAHKAGCLHLLLAHHREDQAETFLLRLARGSGLEGLAAMPAIRETAFCRLLRPLLAVPRARLAATLAAAGQEWIADPSNENPAFARVRLRRSAALLAGEGLSPARLAATAHSLGRARAAIEPEVARLLAEAVALDPAGFAWLDAARLCGTPTEIGLRALARLVATVGGGDYGARLERLERLHRALMEGLGHGRTLGGCRFLPRRGQVLVCREAAATAPPIALQPGSTARWDGRFAIRIDDAAPDDRPLDDLALGALGSDAPAEAPRDVPAAVLPTLPALRDLAGIAAIPHLQYERPDRAGVLRVIGVTFRPERALAGAGFTVV